MIFDCMKNKKTRVLSEDEMGIPCSKTEYELVPSTDEHQQTARHSKLTPPAQLATAWHDRCNITVESFSTTTKRLLPKKFSVINGCRSVTVCRISVQKKIVRTPTSQKSKKSESRLNCVLHMPLIDWGNLAIKKQVPKLLPMNLWQGETYVFGFLSSNDSLTSSKVTVEGQVGNEKVCIQQQICPEPSLSTEKWKQIGDILDTEMRKHKMTIPKESVEEIKTSERRDTGYQSYKISSDTSQLTVRNDDSTDSDAERTLISERRLRSRRKDTPSQPSPLKGNVHKSYKKRVEDSKLVEERESSFKSTDDNKSASSAEKQDKQKVIKQIDNHRTEQNENRERLVKDRHDKSSPKSTGSLTNVHLTSEITHLLEDNNGLHSTRKTSSAPGESGSPKTPGRKGRARKKRSSFRKLSHSVSATETDGTPHGTNIEHQEVKTTKDSVFRIKADEIKWSNDDDADDEIDEKDSNPLSESTNPAENKDVNLKVEDVPRAMTPTPYSDKNIEIRKLSLSEVLEKQHKSALSPNKFQERDNIITEHNGEEKNESLSTNT